jgi:outer membrane protein TolC
MKRSLLFLAISTIVIGMASALCRIERLAAQPKALTLAETIQYGVQRNLAFRNALLEEQISAEKVNETINRYLPRLTGALDGRYNTQIATQVLPARTFNPSAGENELAEVRFGTNWNASASLDLAQPIVDISLGAEIATANAERTLAAANAEKAKNDLKIAIAKAYYTALLNEEKLRQAEANRARNENFYKDVQAKFQNANALQTDVKRAYLNFSNAALEKKRAEDAVRLSYMNLALQISWEGAPEDLRLADNLSALFAGDEEFQNNSLDEALRRRADAQAEIAEREVNIRLLERLRNENAPKLSGYGFIGTQGFGNELGAVGFFPLSYVGMRASVPIADWLTRSATIQRQALQLDKSENALRNLRQTALYELESALVQVRNAVQSVKIQRENVAIAEEIVAATAARFRQGQATNQEVLAAESTLRDTQTLYLQSLFDALVAKLDWKKANGAL